MENEKSPDNIAWAFSLSIQYGLLLFVACTELIYTAGSIDELHLAGKVRVRHVGYLELYKRIFVAVFPFYGVLRLSCGAGQECVVVRNIFENYKTVTFGVNAFFHGSYFKDGKDNRIFEISSIIFRRILRSRHLTIFAPLMNYSNKICIIALLIGASAISSCKKELFTTDPSAKLEFSTTSILYDTVFTTVGSVTKTFIVYNRNSQPVKISSIRLASGTGSNFRINVDGAKGVLFSDVEIQAKDSMFVFAEVTVDPNKANTPLIIRDSVVFETNGNVQDVDFEAWGQDAYFHTPNVFPTNGFPAYSVIPCNATWTNDKPHVIYGFAVVDSACTLTMNPGTRVYMHPNSVLWIYKDGSLKIKGNISVPVTIQGDRLEPQYSEEAGQWGYIWLSPGSKNNEIDGAVIKNGIVGILADTVGNSVAPTLKISNTIIKNMSVAAVYGRGTYIHGVNCVFANCGQYVAALTIGGKYNFYHCTFANYWNNGTRQFPVLLLSNYYEDVNENIISRDLDSAFFYNCIVYGDLNSGDEIKLDKSQAAAFTYKFHHSLLKTTFNTSGSEYINVVANMEPYFYNVGNNDYRIKNPFAAPAVIFKGDPAIGALYPVDLSGNSRIVNPPPTLGAYEYEP